MKDLKSFVLMIILMITLCACSNSGKPDRPDSDEPGHPPSLNEPRNDYGASSDWNEFVSVVGSDGLMEVQAAKLALENSKDQAVQDFAKMILQDHQKLNKKLSELLITNNMEPQADMLESDIEKMLKLKATSPDDFDQRYVDTMIESHKTAIKMLKDASTGENGSEEGADTEATAELNEPEDRLNPEILLWIQETLPVLQRHLEQAKQLQAQL